MSSSHGKIVRGLMSTKNSPLFQGRFGRMFRSLSPASFGKDDNENFKNLTKLGAAMINDFDEPKDSPDGEESGIPALYTYLGQFIDHDITFDPASSLQQQNDPDALTDFRTPALDLDNVYGRGPDDQPYMYKDDKSFLFGDPINGGNINAKDLARNSVGRALIGDPRNDENTIVSQLQGLFLRFHNRAVEDNQTWEFARVQEWVRFHYQYVVLNDFLPRIIHPTVLQDLKTDNQYDKSKLKFFHWKNDPFMPIEFSAAAYRLGHSMVRPGYRLNNANATLLPIFPVPEKGLNEGLTGFRTMNPNWGIDWARFIDIELRSYGKEDAEDEGNIGKNRQRLQFAYRLDTSIIKPLSILPAPVVMNPSPTNPPSLAGRNLLRGWRLGLPSGQDVARAMCINPLKDEDINLGAAVDEPEKPLVNILDVSEIFKGNCPLWTYILAEAMQYKEKIKIPVVEETYITTPLLGPVGGRIVAEVFLGLMFGDKNSYLSLNPCWTPEQGADYKLKDLVNYALGN